MYRAYWVGAASINRCIRPSAGGATKLVVSDLGVLGSAGRLLFNASLFFLASRIAFVAGCWPFLVPNPFFWAFDSASFAFLSRLAPAALYLSAMDVAKDFRLAFLRGALAVLGYFDSGATVITPVSLSTTKTLSIASLVNAPDSLIPFSIFFC